MLATYKDYTSMIESTKMDFERQETEYNWNFVESKTKVGDNFEYMIANKAGLSVIIRYDANLMLLTKIHFSDSEAKRLLDLFQTL